MSLIVCCNFYMLCPKRERKKRVNETLLYCCGRCLFIRLLSPLYILYIIFSNLSNKEKCLGLFYPKRSLSVFHFGCLGIDLVPRHHTQLKFTIFIIFSFSDSLPHYFYSSPLFKLNTFLSTSVPLIT